MPEYNSAPENQPDPYEQNEEPVVEQSEDQPLCVCCEFLRRIVSALYEKLGHGPPTSTSPNLVLTPESFSYIRTRMLSFFENVSTNPQFIQNPFIVFHVVAPAVENFSSNYDIRWMHYSAVPQGATSYTFDNGVTYF